LWRDAFGLILGQSAYYYAPQYSGQGIGFLTVPNANLGCVEHPTVLETPPDSGLLQLDAISIVRVFEDGAGYLVVAGNYAPGGDLQALSRGKVVRRENVSPDAIRASESTVNGSPSAPSMAPIHADLRRPRTRERRFGPLVRPDVVAETPMTRSLPDSREVHMPGTLTSWNDGASKRAIEEFVGRVTTTGSPDFVEPSARIAVFDNDGTL
jgi:hypothetical protein